MEEKNIVYGVQVFILFKLTSSETQGTDMVSFKPTLSSRPGLAL
jgi:hypothetical protein